MNYKQLIRFGAVALLSVSSVFAQDASESPIVLELQAKKLLQTRAADGTVQTELVAVDKVLPGETVVYTINYRNTGSEAAGDIALTNPIPQEMIYLTGSAIGEGAVITFSVDGGASFQAADELYVTEADGSRRLAVAADYDVVRWQLVQPLAAGGSGSVSYRAVLK